MTLFDDENARTVFHKKKKRKEPQQNSSKANDKSSFYATMSRRAYRNLVALTSSALNFLFKSTSKLTKLTSAIRVRPLPPCT